MKDQNETVHDYLYDSLGRLISDQIDSFGDDVDTAVARIDRAYEVRGMLEKVTSYDNSETPGEVNQVVFEYNGLGLPSVEYQEHGGLKDANTLAVGYAYDDTASGGELTLGMRPKWVDYPNARRVHFTYGASTSAAHYLNRLDAINADNGSGLPGDVLAQYAYLGLATPVIEDFPEPQLKLDYFGGTSGTYAAFDRFGRVLDQRWIDYGPNPTVDAARIQHAYDRLGNRLYREDPVAAANSADVDELYAYDGMNQLVVFQRGDLTQDSSGEYTIISNAFAEQWTLDPTGNWAAFKQDTDGNASWNLEQTRSHNEANEIDDIDQTAGTAWITPVHDAAGNMTTVPKPTSLANGLTCKFDAWNRLVKVEDGENTLAEYAYDGQNRRTLKKVYDGGQLDQTRHFFYSNQWQVLEERVDASTDADRQYVWGARYVDELILRDRNADADPETGNLGKTASGLDERCYAMQDANWNVVAIADENGDVQERYAYAAYGQPEYRNADFTLDASDTDHDWTTLYTGRELDRETGLYQYRNRYYSAEVGRFVSRDPIGYRGGIDLYAYVRNAPIRFTDPEGLVWALVDFVNWYYIGGGAPIDLGLVGLLGEFQSATDVQRSVNEFKDQVSSSTLDDAQALECTKGSQTKNDYYSDTDVTNVTSETHLYAVGHSTFYRSASRTITVPDCKCCKLGSLIAASADYTFSFKIKDAFEDPLDIGIEVGVPYKINAFWTETRHDKLALSCPAK